jgi:Tol biopolymer transport system component
MEHTLGDVSSKSGFALTVSLLQFLLLCLVATCGCDSTKPNKLIPPTEYPRVAYSEPIWSPDGQRLAFNHRPLDSIYVDASGHHQYVFDDSLAGFWMVNSDGTGLTRVLPTALAEPSWSPDGKWIAYSKTGDIWKIGVTPSGVDTLNDKRLTFQGVYLGPAWNPASTWLVFWKLEGAATGLYRMGAVGGGPGHFGGSGWRDPNWSLDSLRIVFAYVEGASPEIAYCTAAGDSVHLVKANLLVPEYPKWSPDGTAIAFMDRSPTTQRTHVWIINTDGTNLRMATPDMVANGFAWSPDGRKIAYVRFNLNDFSLTNGTVWTVDVVTGELQQLTYNGSQRP